MGWPNTWGNMEPWRRRTIYGALAVAFLCFLTMPSRRGPSLLLRFWLPEKQAFSLGMAGPLAMLVPLFVAFMLYSLRPKP